MTDAEKNNSDLRLMELAARNPSLGGRELMMEIIERGPMPEEIERPNPQDIRAALKPLSLEAQDYRTQSSTPTGSAKRVRRCATYMNTAPRSKATRSSFPQKNTNCATTAIRPSSQPFHTLKRGSATSSRRVNSTRWHRQLVAKLRMRK